jgi:hypothetical protein
MDSLLRKQTRQKPIPDNLEERMDEAITVFRYVKDKDAFMKVIAFTSLTNYLALDLSTAVLCTSPRQILHLITNGISYDREVEGRMWK